MNGAIARDQDSAKMIWFGNLTPFLAAPPPRSISGLGEEGRMQYALEQVAQETPGLGGKALIEALAGTGWVDRPTAERLLPHFRHFDPDRHFAEYLRRLSFRGPSAAHEFRSGVRCIVEEITGHGQLDQVGPEPCVRFAVDGCEGVVLAQPEVGFTIGGRTRDAIAAAVEEMPDIVVVVARNFDRGTGEQLTSVLSRTGIRGTLVTVNLLLGIRATALRYQPRPAKVVAVLGTGGTLRSADVARLGDRAA
jgi:hypothetical protein